MYQYKVLFSLRNPLHKILAKVFPQNPCLLLSLHVSKGEHGNRSQDIVLPTGHVIPKGRVNPHWIAELKLGNGAGYVWGRSLFLAKNALTRPIGSGIRKPWQFGLTQNANRVPYSDGT